MAHTHAHHPEDEAGGRSLLIPLVLNVGIVGAQVVGSLLSGSLALLADAVHDLSDSAAVINLTEPAAQSLATIMLGLVWPFHPDCGHILTSRVPARNG